MTMSPVRTGDWKLQKILCKDNKRCAASLELMCVELWFISFGKNRGVINFL